MPPAALPRFRLDGWDRRDIADPYPVYRRYREAAPVHLGTHRPGTGAGAGAGSAPDSAAPGTFYAFSYEEVQRVLTSRRFGRTARTADGDGTGSVPVPDRYRTLRAVVGNWLVFLDPPRHTVLRALLAAEFSPTVVAALRPRIAQLARGLLDRLGRQPRADLVAGFAAPLPVLVVSELLGVPAEHHDWLRAGAVALQEASSSRACGGADGYARAEAAARDFTRYFRQEVSLRRGTGRDDLLSLLVRARESGAPLSVDGIVGTCVHLLTAGHETTTGFLGKAVLALRARPGLRAELRAVPSLVPAAVEEILRHDPPVQAVTRWAQQDTRLGGLDVPRGSRVVALLGSACRDPARFPHPDDLDVHRRADRHLSFGLGIHYCLGATLARAEAETGLRELLTGGARWLDHGSQQVDYADDMVFHGPRRLVLDTSAARPGAPGEQAGEQPGKHVGEQAERHS